MGQSEGREDEQQAAQAGSVSEDTADVEGSTKGSAQRVGVQAFRGRASSTTGLDIQVTQDEPEQLIRILRETAETYEGPRHREWTIITRYASQCEEALEKYNEPRAR